MIKATELRIGNWVKEGLDTHTVGSWGIGMIDRGEIHCGPIPLTEEWLLKAGFKPLTWTDGGVPVWKGYEHKEDSTFLINSDMQVDGLETKPLQYVHQLQNLYYALTGTELTFQ